MSENKPITPQQYFNDRMELLGVTDDINKIALLQVNTNTQPHTTELVEHSIFSAGTNGIDILCYTLTREKINFAKEGSRWKNQVYKITRLVEPKIKKDGSTQKYDMPKGVAVVPFFPPQLVAKFDAKETIETLVLTEGYFKAFKAAMCNIDCVGLPSITCLKDKETGELHPEIKTLVQVCKVQRIIWLTDGDCRNITTKDINESNDLYRRPHQFFRSVASFYDLTSKLDINRYFVHIQSDNLEGEPKGLDDLLIEFNSETKKIAKELITFDQKKDKGYYFNRFDITFGVGKVHRYFMLHDVDQFYLHHVEKRPELSTTQFKFNGTLYAYDDRENKCVIKIPSSAEHYFRVGDDYHEFVEIPDKYNNLTKTYHKRRKETIKDDNGKDIFLHIPKYKAFCNVPDHINYQRVINNCFNTYHPFAHEPEPGECKTTLDFIKHVFGEDDISIDETQSIKRHELALDYLTLLYKFPQQILPILCLVSKERQTGKTTFLKWLKLIFTENCAIVGNQDFENNFNSHWATKLIIGCDETKIEKHVVMERIKGLSTASSIMKEGKGVDQISMDFFGKFILLSNNEENFASIDKEEIRFWVIKVPVIKQRNVSLLDDLLDEIPAFLHFLSQRKIITKNRERHWFDTRLLRTEALARIMDNSKPTIQKILGIALADLFNSTQHLKITMPLDAIVKELLKGKYERNYVKDTLNEMGYKVSNVGRLFYPRIMEKMTDGKVCIEAISVEFHNRYYTFNRSEFTSDEPIENTPQNDDMPF